MNLHPGKIMSNKNNDLVIISSKVLKIKHGEKKIPCYRLYKEFTDEIDINDNFESARIFNLKTGNFEWFYYNHQWGQTVSAHEINESHYSDDCNFENGWDLDCGDGPDRTPMDGLYEIVVSWA